MAFGLVTRILARLLAMGALCGAWILLLIISIGIPVRPFSFLTTTFQNGNKLELGIWGSCYTQGAQRLCTKTSLGYQTIANTLPAYSQNSGPLVNITEKPLTAALIWFPLAAGSTSLANLLSLVPIRIVTMLALAMTFLSIGAQAIAFAIALAAFVRAQVAIKISFTPIGFAQPKLGECLWMSISALVVTVGAFLFLLAALEPKKTKDGKSEYGNTYNSGAMDGSYTGEKYAPERAASIRGTSRASQLGAADRSIDGRRRRSAGGSRRHHRHRDDYDDDEDRGSRARRTRSRYDSESDVSDEEPVRRPQRSRSQRSAGSRRSRRDYGASDEEEDVGGGDFTTRRTGSRVQAY